MPSRQQKSPQKATFGAFFGCFPEIGCYLQPLGRVARLHRGIVRFPPSERRFGRRRQPFEVPDVTARLALAICARRGSNRGADAGVSAARAHEAGIVGARPCSVPFSTHDAPPACGTASVEPVAWAGTTEAACLTSLGTWTRGMPFTIG
jgi:hypothetical protein